MRVWIKIRYSAEYRGMCRTCKTAFPDYSGLAQGWRAVSCEPAFRAEQMLAFQIAVS